MRAQCKGGQDNTKRTNNNLQSTTQKTNDRAPRTVLKIGMNAGVPRGLTFPVPLVTSVVILLNNANTIVN